MRALIFLLGVFVSLLVFDEGHARAEEKRSRVVILRARGDDATLREASARLSAELVASGFEVETLDVDLASDPRAAVESHAATSPGERAFATIALLRNQSGPLADVWVADHVTQKTLVRRVDATDVAAAQSAQGLAIRSVELLRASLLEVSRDPTVRLPVDVARWAGVAAPPSVDPATPAPTPPRPTPPLPTAPVIERPRVEPLPPPRPSPAPTTTLTRAWLGAGAIGEGGVGGAGFFLGPALLARFLLVEGVAVRGDLSIGFGTHTMEASDANGDALGTATSRLSRAAVGVDFFDDPGAVLSPRLGASLGIALFDVSGEGAGSSQGLGRSDSSVSFAPIVRGGLALRPIDELAIVPELFVSLVTPDPVVIIGGERAASLGPATLGFDLSVEIAP